MVLVTSCKDSIIEDLPTPAGNLLTTIIAINNDVELNTSWRHYMISDASVGIKEITYSNSTKSETAYQDDFIYDLINKESTPELNFTTLSNNEYDHATINIDNHLENNYSFDIKGTYNPSSPISIKFFYTTDIPMEINHELEDNLIISDSTITQIELAFNLKKCFDLVEFDQLNTKEIDVELGNGQIVKETVIEINAIDNKATYELLNKELQESLETRIVAQEPNF